MMQIQLLIADSLLSEVLSILDGKVSLYSRAENLNLRAIKTVCLATRHSGIGVPLGTARLIVEAIQAGRYTNSSQDAVFVVTI